MKLIALIDDNEVIEKILRHLKLWPEQTAPACMPGRSLSAKAGLSRAPPRTLAPDDGERIIEPCFDDPFPDYPVTTLPREVAYRAQRGHAITWNGSEPRCGNAAHAGLTWRH
jgi:hypothetical protein